MTDAPAPPARTRQGIRKLTSASARQVSNDGRSGGGKASGPSLSIIPDVASRAGAMIHRQSSYGSL
jgi:hypothetical protein